MMRFLVVLLTAFWTIAVAPISAMDGRPPDGGAARRGEAFRQSLMIALKNRSYVDAFAAQARAQGVPGAQLLYRPLAGDVIIVPVEDRPRISRFLRTGEGRRFGLSDEDVFDAALKNLKARAERVQLIDFGGLRALSFETDYNASLLLVPKIWESVPDLPAHLVVALPARDIMAFGDGRDPQAVAALRGVAAMPDDGYPVTKLLFKRVADGWQVLK